MGPTSTAAPLIDVPVGSHVVLVGHDAGSHRVRLAEIGLRTGCRLVVLSRTVGGGRVVGVGHTRIAVDRDLAARLRVAALTP